MPTNEKQMLNSTPKHQRAHRCVPDSLFLPRDVRELNGRFKRRLRHIYFCSDITGERGTDAAPSCCSERQNKASPGTDKHPGCAYSTSVCLCVCGLVWRRGGHLCRPIMPFTGGPLPALALVHTHTSSIVRLIRCDGEQCVTKCGLPCAMLFFEGMLSLDVTSRG